ncbi:MAG: hypothetical protein KA527_08305 [Cytophagaceae bacterium]|uniref:hypothetical protein n=1 Tax=Aquirufa regiilacus TaxID=3024868 RepID=UPI001B6515FE|nr:hypothetical protein [Aquirufa sp. LEPPI-3A]MBP6055626.1 hypothetical protein [Cytophagaceae bacterium]MBP6094540.1 hypothetical protein [Cytophagaceae bacterium]MDT8886450.1 hypothetical protein [Aquirufa sp. LEPPI-3A]
MKIFQGLLICLLSVQLLSCGSSAGSDPAPTPQPTVSQLVSKSWSVSSASWDGVTQYSKGATSNLVSGYSQFKLDLTSSTSASLTEFDGRKFTGTYTLSVDNKKITLNGLTSSEGAPSGTNGTLEFNIVGTPSASALSLETSSTYIKASNKKVSLALVNP